MTTKTNTVSPITFDELFDLDKNEMVSIRMKIPGPLNELIEDYQGSYADLYGRRMSKESVIWYFMTRSVNTINEEIVAMDAEIARREKITGK